MGDNTKERIIHNAFMLYADSWDKEVSLSQIASLTGISKTAIFRHFADKGALLAAMKTQFYDDAAVLMRIMYDTAVPLDERIRNVIAAICSKGEYLCFVLRLLTSDSDLGKELRTAFIERDVPLCSLSNVSGFQFLYIIYIGSLVMTSSLCYIVSVQNQTEYKTKLPDPDTFADGVRNWLQNGWQFLQKIDNKSQEKLDTMCLIDNANLRQESRFFVAVTRLIQLYGLPGVTVDRLADELHMAKSSLYNYSKNKQQLIHSVIKEEVEQFAFCLREKVSCAQSFSECVYIMLRTSVSYLIARPNVSYVLAWGALFNAKKGETVRDRAISDILRPFLLDISIPQQYQWMKLSALTRFVELLATSLVIHGTKQGFSTEQLISWVPVLYECIRAGPQKAGLQYSNNWFHE